MEQLVDIHGVGETVAQSVAEFLAREDSRAMLDKLRAAGVQLREEVDAHFGETRIEIGILDDTGFMALAETASALTWKVRPSIFRKLKRMPGVAGCLIETDPLRLKETKRRWAKKAWGMKVSA